VSLRLELGGRDERKEKTWILNLEERGEEGGKEDKVHRSQTNRGFFFSVPGRQAGREMKSDPHWPNNPSVGTYS
jgi:hypothetical protein